jgi:hypothetical protein
MLRLPAQGQEDEVGSFEDSALVSKTTARLRGQCVEDETPHV